MTKDERNGVVFPLPASYRANDPALTDTSPANIRQILTNARNGQLWDQERLYRTMLDTWPRMVKNLSEFQGAVAGLGLTIEPAKREGMEEPTPNAVRIHDVVSRAIESYAPRPGYWELGLTDMIKALVEPYVKGISALEIVWHVQNGIVSPRCYAPVPGKYLAYPNQSNEVDRLMLAPTGINNSVLEDFPPNKFLIAVWCKGGSHPVYAANLRPLSKYWVASVYGLGWLMQYGQLFGIPWRHVETDGSEGAQAEAESLLENIGASGWAITTKGVALNILDGVSGSTDSLPQVKMMEEADKACDIMLLGQTLTTDVGDSGSRALGDVHAGVRKEKLQDVANWVAGIITDQLIPAIVRLNFGDVPAEDMPYCKIVIPEAKDDKANAERVKILSEIGIEMPRAWVHETVGVPVPVEGEAVFEKKEPEMPLPAVPGQTPQETEDDIEEEQDDEEDLRPDESMAANAQAALDAMRGKGIVSRAISAIAMHRARQIADRTPLSPATLDKMKAYFSRVDPAIVHAAAADEGKAWIEWNSWGGDAAKEWIESK